MQTSGDQSDGYPLDVLIIGGHRHGSATNTGLLLEFLADYPNVRSFGSVDESGIETARQILTEGRANTIIVEPWILDRRGPAGGAAEFIKGIREEHPTVLIALSLIQGPFPESWRPEWFAEHPRFRHYFAIEELDNRSAHRSQAFEVLRKCEREHYRQWDFDVTISYAGEDRKMAEELADELTKRGARTFYDAYFEDQLLGADLQSYLREVYSKRSRYCIVLASSPYARKVWPRFELRTALERSIKSGHLGYVLPIRIDATELSDLPTTIGYLHADRGAPTIADIIARKLWLPSAQEGISPPAKQRILVSPIF